MVLAICLKIYNCDEQMLDKLAEVLDATDVPQLDKKTFAVHHLWAVRCVERFWCAYSERRQTRKHNSLTPRNLQNCTYPSRNTSLQPPNMYKDSYLTSFGYPTGVDFITPEQDAEQPIIVFPQVSLVALPLILFTEMHSLTRTALVLSTEKH